MTLPTSGALHLAQIGYEAGKPLMSQIDIGNADVRKLCNKLTAGSQISIQDFYGTAYGVGPGYGAQNFTDITGDGLNVYIITSTIYLHDAPEGGAAMAVQTTAADAMYSINGGAWTDSSVLGLVKRSDSIALKILTGSQQNVTTTSQVVYGGISKSINITTATITQYIYIHCQINDAYPTKPSSIIWSSYRSYAADPSIYANYVFGTWLPTPTVNYADNVKQTWKMQALPGDGVHTQIGITSTSGSKTALANYGSTPEEDHLPSVYMGQTRSITAYATWSSGFKLDWTP